MSSKDAVEGREVRPVFRSGSAGGGGEAEAGGGEEVRGGEESSSFGVPGAVASGPNEGIGAWVECFLEAGGNDEAEGQTKKKR